MKVHSFTLGPFAANCVVLENPGSSEVLLVDPGFEVEQVLAWLAKEQKSIHAVVLTHAHLDHAWGCATVQGSFPELVVWVHRQDLPLLQNLPMQAQMFGFPPPAPVTKVSFLEDQQILWLGGEKVVVRHTPGHSPGHVILVGEDSGAPWAVVGDVIFAGSVGRTDLWGGSWEQLEASIRGVVYRLPDHTVLYPGHGPTTTVRQERVHNPFVSAF
ncbi:MAG: MBL fold metallo-hydrolase [Thermoanaerobaculum sp.]|nr:MBL fold metallo-hydrolase [Thermoanaerobaculum sp.]MCX7895599.1 MBL fold metallo-hydrolase [Thermoanaerobaculum sp.]MDW7967459.1 MBL fold metallo-hydrolase [Thermoanaerobaculum sp.]